MYVCPLRCGIGVVHCTFGVVRLRVSAFVCVCACLHAVVVRAIFLEPSGLRFFMCVCVFSKNHVFTVSLLPSGDFGGELVEVFSWLAVPIGLAQWLSASAGRNS